MSTAKLSATSATSATFVPAPPAGQVGLGGSMRPKVQHTGKCNERGNKFTKIKGKQAGIEQDCTNGDCVELENLRKQQPQQKPQAAPVQQPQQQPQQQPEPKPQQQPQAAPVVPQQQPQAAPVVPQQQPQAADGELVVRGPWFDSKRVRHGGSCDGKGPANSDGRRFPCHGHCMRGSGADGFAGAMSAFLRGNTAAGFAHAAATHHLADATVYAANLAAQATRFSADSQAATGGEANAIERRKVELGELQAASAASQTLINLEKSKSSPDNLKIKQLEGEREILLNRIVALAKV